MTIRAQDPVAILNKVFEKCQTISQGYYEVEKYMKYMDENDTVFTHAHSFFRKIPSDTLNPFLLNTTTYYQNGTFHKNIYTGDAFLLLNYGDSICTKTDAGTWGQLVKQRCRSTLKYNPIVSSKGIPFHITKNESEPYSFYFMGESMIQDIPCYHIKAKRYPARDSSEMMNTYKHEFQFWIKKSDCLPIQYTETFDEVLNNDTLYQYEKYVLKRLDTISSIQPEKFTLSDVPDYFSIEDYKEYEIPQLLPAGTSAPDWTLTLLTDDSLSFQSLRGKLVLLDFFYKGCYPCIKAIPSLLSIYKKYEDKGFTVIGVNPFDAKESGINDFVRNMGITYPVVLGAKDVADIYNVAVYPTLYLIGPDGKIIYSRWGYGPDTEKELEEIINSNLTK